MTAAVSDLDRFANGNRFRDVGRRRTDSLHRLAFCFWSSLFLSSTRVSDSDFNLPTGLGIC